MKKITLLLFTLVCFFGFSQTKSTGIINLTSNMTASLTLNNSTSKVTLVLTGPSDRWFALGFGVASGFGMSSGDVLVYTTSLSDRYYSGTSAPSTDATQDWTTVSNNVVLGVRTLTLERSLINADTNDFQFPYASTNSISLAWARSSSASTTLSNHGSTNRGFATGTFTLSNDKFSLESASIYPNPSNGNFTIKTNVSLTNINLYSQTGVFVKEIKFDNDLNEINIELNGFASGVYFLELKSETQKSWKKIILN